MLYYDRIDVSEGIPVNKKSALKESGKKYYHKTPIFWETDIEKVSVSNKISFGKKTVKTSPYVKSYDGQTKWMYFLIIIIVLIINY